jgi:SAM-dependent methyltransferase
MTTGHCRFCAAPLHRSFVDLGRSPLANSFLSRDDIHRMEPFYPLQAYVCDSCCLVQLEEVQNAQTIFGDYLYFSSYSEGWLRHAEAYATRMIERLRLDQTSRVVEVASNDGYLLQYFQSRGIQVLGVEPAVNVAKVATAKGIPSEPAFFGVETARRLAAQGHHADLMTANNVLAHVPDLNDFVAGFPILLKRHGVATFEFPHLLRLIQQRQFDTIYHEHFSYLSLLVVDRVFAHHGLTAYDVELLPTHGGSLRVYATHSQSAPPSSDRFRSVLAAEKDAGLDQPESYADFGSVVADIKCQLLTFLIGARRDGKTVAGYGAPAKGNTLLNYCGIGPELLPFTVDRSPHKQGRYLPGVQIPIAEPELIFRARPDYLLLLPWNLKDEITGQMEGIRDWGGRFVTAIPNLEID